MTIGVVLTKSTPNRLVYQITGDSSLTAATITSATLVADAIAGPLKNALQASYASQAAMRAQFGGGNIPMRMNSRSLGGAFAADVDTDAVTVTRPEINLVVPATAAVAYLEVQHVWSAVR